MYIFEEMINLGFPDDEEVNWMSEDHKIVAQNLCLCNPSIHDRSTLIACVTVINKVPQDRIRTVTYQELVDEFNLPEISF